MPITRQQLTGMFPALPTPFTSGGDVDTAALSALVEHLVDAGASGLVPVGGTGEYTALSPAARVHVVATTVRAARGRVPIISGVLSPGYQEALDAGRAFMSAGANALLLITPFYATPTQAGLRAYFSAYAKATGAPLLLYDIPGRTGIVVTPETIAAMAEEGTIIGMKACNTDLNHFRRTVALAGNKIALLSGDDYLYPMHTVLGGHGGILASSILLPRYWQRIADLAAHGDFRQALDAHRVLVPLLDALFSETNPGPLKAAMQLAGMPLGQVVLPLLPPGAALLGRLDETLSALAQQGVDELCGLAAR